jgi:hypothetical protein
VQTYYKKRGIKNMISKGNFEESAPEASVQAAKLFMESMKQKGNFEESIFKEDDNTMANSASWYTTKLAKIIYYKAYDAFKGYFDMTWVLSPSDIGSVDGAGAYRIPQVVGAIGVKLESGEVVDYINDGKGYVTLETATWGIGTRINRRIMKRAGAGIIDRLIQAASEAVLRAVCLDLITGMINGASTSNRVAEGISYESIEKARENIRNATNTKGQLFGLEPDFIGFTATGWRIYALDNTIQAMVSMGQRNVPGNKLENDYPIVQGLKKVDINLAGALTSNSKLVHAILVCSKDFMCWLKETEMDVFDGRLPGTVDHEIIHCMDCGQIVLNDKAAAVITAA